MAWLCEHMEDPDIDDPIASVDQSKVVQFNSSDLNSLISMGFSEERCKRSLINTNHNGAEAAMSWLFEHMEDSALDAPLDTAVNAEPYSESDITQLTEMGFTIPQARKALKETGNDMTRAVDWLFSHPGDSGNESSEVMPLQMGYIINNFSRL
jgi:ubiquitin carboxyl-terminal hydrolase 5/13